MLDLQTYSCDNPIIVKQKKDNTMLDKKLDLVAHENFIHFLNAFAEMSKGRYKITSFNFEIENSDVHVVFDMHCLEKAFTTSRTGDKEFYCVETWRIKISDGKTPEFDWGQVIKTEYMSEDGDYLYSYT